ncbi:MAG TPA: CBS domain-containing protein [Candidatus Nanopelagicales bacterium]|nr:CBS domain-containing protein [Candidatus Nanopelagicales bacterium]
MRVSQILTGKGHDVFAIAPDASVADLVQTLAERRVGALLVRGADGAIAGIVSERDIVRALGAQESVLHDPVASIMTSDVVTVSHDADVSDLMRLMTDRRIRHIPVMDDDDALLGVVSIGDVVKNRMDELEAERAALVDYITQGG